MSAGEQRQPAVALIYARSRNYCIGREGQLPWRLPDEYAHFLKIVRGSAVIMGRKTWEENNSALQDCRNLVVSRNSGLALPPGVQRAGSLQQALGLLGEEKRVFVLGGVSLYREALPLAEEVYETVVMTEVDGDTYIDAFDFSGWQTRRLLVHEADRDHAFGFAVYRHSRRG